MSHLRIYLSALFVIAVAAQVAECQQLTWQTGDGPYGGGIQAFARSTATGTLVAAHNYDLSRSTDNGRHWQKLLDMDTWDVVYANGAFYSTNQMEVIRSTDDGVTWLPFFVPQSPEGNFLRKNDNGDLLMIAGDHFYLSDHGGNWQLLDTVPEWPRDVEFDNDRTIRMQTSACGEVAKYWVSTDMAKSWKNWEVYPGTVLVGMCTMKSGVLLATTDSGMYRSLDQGKTWAITGSGLPKIPQGTPWIYTGVKEGTHGQVYCSAPDGLYQSVDSGASWTRLKTTGYHFPVSSLIINADGSIIAGGNSFQYSPDGLNWSRCDSGLIQCCWAVANSPRGTVLAGVQSGIYESSDGGKTWIERSNKGEVSLFCKGPGTTMYASGHNLFRSPDGGATWDTIAGPPVSNWIDFIGYDTVNKLLMVDSPDPMNYGIWYSRDDGGTWTHSVTSNITCFSVTPTGRLSLGGYNVYQSDDGLKTWYPYFSCTFLGSNIVGLANIHDSLVALYQNTGPAIYPKDDGNTYTVSVDIPYGASSLDWIGMDQALNGDLFAISRNSIFRSTNSGRAWTQVADQTDYLWQAAILNSGHLAIARNAGVAISKEILTSEDATSAVHTGAVVGGVAVSVSPNPSTGPVTVDLSLDHLQNVRVEVCDVLGRAAAILYDGLLESGDRALPLALRLTPGVYRVRVLCGGVDEASATFMIE